MGLTHATCFLTLVFIYKNRLIQIFVKATINADNLHLDDNLKN